MNALQEMFDLAGLPRPADKPDPKRLEEDVRETVRQWMTLAPKVVKHQGMKYTLKKNATVKSGETVYFKYWAKKPKGEVMAPIVQFVVKYNRGSDLYDITVESYDINMNKTGSRQMNGMGFENFANLGYLPDVMRESHDPEDAQLADRVREFAPKPERTRDDPDRYGSFDAAIKDMQAQVFDGRRGTEQRPKSESKGMSADQHEAVWGLGAKASRAGSKDVEGAFLDAVKKHGKRVFPAARAKEDDPWFEEYFKAFRDGFRSGMREEKDERIFRMFAFYKGSNLRKMGSVAVPDTKDAKKKASLAGQRLYDYDPHNDHLARGGWEMHDEGTGKAFWVRTQVKHFLDPENRRGR